MINRNVMFKILTNATKKLFGDALNILPKLIKNNDIGTWSRYNFALLFVQPKTTNLKIGA